MVWPWYAAIASFLLIVVGLLATLIADDGAWIAVAGTVGGICLFIFGIMGLSISVERHYGRVGCRTFHRTTNRPTRFVIYTTFSWDCLTPTKDGKWIPTKNLREFGETP